MLTNSRYHDFHRLFLKFCFLHGDDWHGRNHVLIHLFLPFFKNYVASSSIVENHEKDTNARQKKNAGGLFLKKLVSNYCLLQKFHNRNQPQTHDVVVALRPSCTKPNLSVNGLDERPLKKF